MAIVGRGAFGEVRLVRERATGELFALNNCTVDTCEAFHLCGLACESSSGQLVEMTCRSGHICGAFRHCVLTDGAEGFEKLL